MRGSQWGSRMEECLPILSASWCKDLGSLRATVLLQGTTDIKAVLTLHHGSLGIWAIQRYTRTLARFGAAFLRFSRYFLQPSTLVIIFFAFGQSWKRGEVFLLVFGCVWIKARDFADVQRGYVGIIYDQVVYRMSLILAYFNLLVGDLLLGKCLD